MSKIKSLVIGLGKVGLHYDLPNFDTCLSHCNSLNNHKKFELAGGVDTNKYSRKIFENKFKKATYNNIKFAIQKVRPNLIVLSTPTNKHFRNIKEIIQNKNRELKYLVLEKPLSYSFYEAKKILKICNQNKIKFFINYPYVHENYLKKIKLILKNNINDQPIINLTYSKGMCHIGSHLLKIFIYFLGKPSQIIKINSEKNSDDFYFQGIIKFKKIKVFFNYFKKINTANIEIIHSKGQIIIDLNSLKIWNRSKFKKLDSNNINVLGDKFHVVKNSLSSAQYYYYSFLFKCLKQKKIITNNNDEFFIEKILYKIKNI